MFAPALAEQFRKRRSESLEGSQMSKSRWFQVMVLFAIVAFCACSQMAFARPRAVVATGAQSQAHPDALFPAPGLYANWTNDSDGVELWPCFGDGGGNGNCPTIGNPVIPFSGIAVGDPYFVWSLANCDGTTRSEEHTSELQS